MENLESLEPLLRKISELTQEEKLLKCEKEKRGENFNVFEILHIQNYEVKTHSAIIAELLNPKGTHGCKSAFLSLFIEMFLKSHKELFSFSESDWQYLSDWNVFVEYNIGKVSDDKENGGRLDILLKSSNGNKKAIIIENKIYASDQEKQLYRYQNFAKNYGKGNCAIIYLTLDGHQPNEDSIKCGDCVMKEDEDFCRMSYQSFMLDWLNACKEKATSKPLVRETISQYINTIAKLTHQNMENTTKEKLIKQLANEKNISAVFKINSVYKDVLNKICNTVLIQQIKDIAGELELEYDCKPNIDWFIRYSQFHFSKPEWKHFCIGFEFMGNNLTDFNYGIKFKDGTDKSVFQDQKNQINKLLEGQQVGEGKQGEWWAWFKRFENFDSWDNEKAFEALYNETIKEAIKQKITKILKVLDESIL